MVIDSFTSKEGDRYTLESSGGKYHICKNGKPTGRHDSSESYMRNEFDKLKRSIGK